MNMPSAPVRAPAFDPSREEVVDFCARVACLPTPVLWPEAVAFARLAYAAHGAYPRLSREASAPAHRIAA